MSNPPTIGIFGGHTVYELGPPADVEAFFAAVKAVPVAWPADVPPELITDRLHRRYLKAEELPAARRAMAAIRAAFDATALPADPALQAAVQAPQEQASRLPAQAATVGALFAGLFERFDEAVEAALAFQADFGIYQAVRLVIADMPAFMVDKKRPLSQYDTLQGEPFWKR